MMSYESELSAAILFVVVLFAVYYKAGSRRNCKLPIGPRGLPFIVNALQIKSNMHKKLSDWACIFGPLYTINIFGQKGLVISDLKLMKQAFGTKESTGKSKDDPFSVMLEENLGITNAVGHHAIEQRKFFLRTLKEISSIKGAFSHESVILESCQQILDGIFRKLEKSDVIEVEDLFHDATSTAMWTIVKGDAPVDIKENANMTNYMDMVLKDLEAACNSVLPMIAETLGIISTSYRQLEQSSKRMRALVKENFDARRNLNNNNKSNPNHGADILKTYIYAVESCRDRLSSFYGDMGWRHCYSSIMSLLLASTETTSSTMKWIVFQMAAHPECQTKMQQEIDSVLGTNLPNISHRMLLPYLQAVILETLRFSPIVPVGIWHVLLDKMNFEGFMLPKGLFLIPNLHHINMDSVLWGDPEIFRPERFLTRNHETGQLSLKRMKHNVVSFQTGRRSCPGEALAKDVLFLFTTVIFQKFKFSIYPSLEKTDFLKPVGGFILKPEVKKVRVQGRTFCYGENAFVILRQPPNELLEY